MDFTYSEEELLIAKLAQDFAARSVRPGAAARDLSGEFPSDLVRQMGELGLMGITMPEQYGGAGASAMAYYAALEEIAKACAATAVIAEVHTSLVSEPILQFGSEEQKAKFLPPLARGAQLGSFALTEPNAGSDAAAIQTVAVRDGDDYVIDGSKMFITNAGVSDLLLVMAMTDRSQGTRGITAFIVPARAPGVAYGKPLHKLGIRASQTAEITFTGVRVPAANRLGEEGQGFRIAMWALDGGRIGIATQATGIALAALEAGTGYAKTRVQFGKPIAELQAVQWMLADMATGIDAARLLWQRAAFLKDQGKRFAKEAAMAKLMASEVAMECASKAIQIHGGYGYTTEYPVERLLRDAKITEIYEGTSEIQRLVIALSLLR